MEEVRDGANLVFRHVRGKHEALEGEPAEKEFDSVSLNHIVHQNDCLSLNDSQLNAGKEQHKFVQLTLRVTVQVLNPLDQSQVSFVFLVKLDHQSFFVAHEMGLNALELIYLL